MEPLNLQEPSLDDFKQIGALFQDFFKTSQATDVTLKGFQASFNDFKTNLTTLESKVEAVDLKLKEEEKKVPPLLDRVDQVNKKSEEQIQTLNTLNSRMNKVGANHALRQAQAIREEQEHAKKLGMLAASGMGIGGLTLISTAVPAAWGITLFGAGVDGMIYSFNTDLSHRFRSDQFLKKATVGAIFSGGTSALSTLVGPIRNLGVRILFQSAVNATHGFFKKAANGQCIKANDIAISFFAGTGAACARIPLDKFLGMPEEFLNRILFAASQGALSSATYRVLMNACEDKPLAQGVIQSTITGGAFGAVLAIPEAIKFSQLKAEYEKQKAEIEAQLDSLCDLDLETQVNILLSLLEKYGYVACVEGKELSVEQLIQFLKMGIPMRFEKGKAHFKIKFEKGRLAFLEANKERSALAGIKSFEDFDKRVDQDIETRKFLEGKSKLIESEFNQYKEVEANKGQNFLTYISSELEQFKEVNLYKKFIEIEAEYEDELAALMKHKNHLLDSLKHKPVVEKPLLVPKAAVVVIPNNDAKIKKKEAYINRLIEQKNHCGSGKKGRSKKVSLNELIDNQKKLLDNLKR